MIGCVSRLSSLSQVEQVEVAITDHLRHPSHVCELCKGLSKHETSVTPTDGKAMILVHCGSWGGFRLQSTHLRVTCSIIKILPVQEHTR